MGGMRVFAIATLLALGALTNAQAAGPVVTIRNDAYAPSTLTVVAGTTVAFINRDDDAHTVTATDGSFDSRGLDTDGAWRHTFERPGTYRYFCELHPFMRGRIVVEPAR
jgi:plastocyanin